MPGTQQDPIWQFSNAFTGFTTSAPPSVAVFSSQFHCLFRDGDGNGLMHIVSSDGVNWVPSPVFHPDYTTSDGPCPVVYMNALHVFFRDGTGNGNLRVCTQDGVHVSAPPNWYIGLNCDGKPAAAVLGNTLCVAAVAHSGNQIMYSVTTDGSVFHNGYTGFNTNGSPGIVTYGGQFHIFYRDADESRVYLVGERPGNGLMHIVSSDGVTWAQSPVFHPNAKTNGGGCGVEFAGKLHVFFMDGEGKGILHIDAVDGVNFQRTNNWSSHNRPPQGWYIGQDCQWRPSAAVLNDTLCVLSMDFGGRGVMRSVTTASARSPVEVS